VPFVDHSEVTYFDFLNGSFSLLFAFQTAPMIAIAMIMPDFAVLLPDNHTAEYFFQFCAHYGFVLVSTIATITAQQSEESSSMSIFVLLIALMVLGLCCLFFIFTAEERRVPLFLKVFIDTQKSELILIRDQLKLLCNNLGVKEPKTHQKVPIVRWVAIFIVFVCFAIGFFVAHVSLMHCLSEHVGSERQLQDAKNALLESMADVTIDALQGTERTDFRTFLDRLPMIRRAYGCPSCSILDIRR
jgi:flagellar basal body-associated protein FliL